MNTLNKQIVQLKLKQWFEKNGRDLPWRTSSDPYVIWLSEIIMQQTRIDQGLPYFYKFLTKYPNVHALAGAELDEVLKLWQGLGYYSRARNLHETAKYVSQELKGIFPLNYKGLLACKGIGPYTAALIASVCYGEPKAVLDGNVKRVMSRLFLFSDPVNDRRAQETLQGFVNELLDHENPGIFNEALMDLGAMICKPKNPDCLHCPLKDFCKAFKNECQDTLPVKTKPKKLKNRYLHYFFMHNNDACILHKRVQNDIWKGLYEFILIENESDNFPKSAFEKRFPDLKCTSLPWKKDHKLSHQHLHISVYEIEVEKIPTEFLEKSILIKNIASYAVPKPLELFLTHLKLL